MKTTIDINDTLFQQAKRLATQRRTVEAALRQFVDQGGSGPAPSFRLRRHNFRGRGLQAGLSEQDWATIHERACEGRIG